MNNVAERKLKTLVGSTDKTAFGLVNHIIKDDNSVDLDGSHLGCVERDRGGWTLVIGNNEGPRHFSRRRAVERGLIEMLGYIL